jgi:hypothetical protein
MDRYKILIRYYRFDRIAAGETSGFNGCCTAMWRANGKTTTL